jgi:serine protease Do
MNQIIEAYKDIVVQIATPYSTGTGFVLVHERIIVTNEHVVRDNQEVVIEGRWIPKQMAQVVFLDQKFDLAFIRWPDHLVDPGLSVGRLEGNPSLREGDLIIAVGHPFGLKYTATQGIVSNTMHLQHDISYIQHDAALNPGNSGGPLINATGRIVGVNTFIIQNGNSIGFSLPSSYLAASLKSFQGGTGTAARCNSCSNIVFESPAEGNYCMHCGSRIKFPSRAKPYEAVGLPRTIEEIVIKLGYQVNLCRRGQNNWELNRGSATIEISYHEQSGLILCDAVLCFLPKTNIKEIYEFLLRKNQVLQFSGFSLRGSEIILSTILIDRYLTIPQGISHITNLLDKADEYDDILVHQYGALWKPDDGSAS